MLTDAELSWLRAAVEETLPNTCVFYSPTKTSDGMGGNTITWGAVGTVLARIDPVINAYGRENLGAAAIRDYSRFTLTVPHDTTLQANWRVVVNGGTFNVVGVGTANSWALDVRAYVERI